MYSTSSLRCVACFNFRFILSCLSLVSRCKKFKRGVSLSDFVLVSRFEQFLICVLCITSVCVCMCVC